VIDSNRKQQRLIDALLTLASSEGGLDQRERIDLSVICEGVLLNRKVDAERLALHLEAKIRPAALDGDPRLVERLVANLVDNAMRHNIARGRIQFSTGVEDGKAVLSVTNTGPVIPTDDVDRLFQPFQRLDPRRAHHRDGHGLGLSIVRAIAAAHGATIAAHPLPEGGLRVQITFPPETNRDQSVTQTDTETDTETETSCPRESSIAGDQRAPEGHPLASSSEGRSP